MKPQKIFLLAMTPILVLQLLFASCAPPAPGASPAASSGDAAAADAEPAAEIARPAQDDAGLIFDQIMVYGNRDQIDKVVAVVEFPLQPVGEPVDLSFLTENWEMRLYQIIDGPPSDTLAERLNKTAQDMEVDVQAEPNVVIESPPPLKPGAGVHGSPSGPPLSEPESDTTKQWAWGEQGIHLGDPPVQGEKVAVGVFDTCPTDQPKNQPSWVDLMVPLANSSTSNQDYLEHGASIASLIDDMAPSARIELYCVLAPDGIGHVADLVRGVAMFVVKHLNAPGVINLSLRVTQESSLLTQGLTEIHKRGFVTVAAAGNDSTAQTVQGMNYPASHSKVMGVAGSDYQRNRAGFSNQGKVAAPAGQQRYTAEETLPPCTPDTEIYIITRASKAGYLCWQGTSFATAFVSGEAALLLSKKPTASAQDIFDRIYQMTDNNPTGDSNLGRGIINVTAALNGW